MLFLLDANVLIDANRDYYPIEAVPEFWEWLETQGTEGNIKIPEEIYEELTQGKEDALSQWAKTKEIKEALMLDEEVSVELLQEVIAEGYADDLSDVELDTIGRDPFLIAYARAKTKRVIVTTEGSKPKRRRANRHVPDVANDFDVKTINTFELIKILEFRTR